MARTITLRTKPTRPDFTPMAVTFTVIEETETYYRVVPTFLPLSAPVVVEKSGWEVVK